MKIYTGIGSRETPEDILTFFTQVANYLGERDFILRSGGANGADLAFEKGCQNDQKEIYIPWKNFNDSDSKFVVNYI